MSAALDILIGLTVANLVCLAVLRTTLTKVMARLDELSNQVGVVTQQNCGLAEMLITMETSAEPSESDNDNHNDDDHDGAALQ